MDLDGSTPHAVFHNVIKDGPKAYKKCEPNEWYAPWQNRTSDMISAYMQCWKEEPEYTTAKWRKGGEQLEKIEKRNEWIKNHLPEGWTMTTGKDGTNEYHGPNGETQLTSPIDFGAENEDYIFFYKDDFEVKQVMSIPEYSELGENLLLDWRHPSDHFHIQADLEYAQRKASDNNVFQHYVNGSWGDRNQINRGRRDGIIGDPTLTLPQPKTPDRRRRMAIREFSNRRDSPVMVRLLQEIIAAQDKK